MLNAQCQISKLRKVIFLFYNLKQRLHISVFKQTCALNRREDRGGGIILMYLLTTILSLTISELYIHGSK